MPTVNPNVLKLVDSALVSNRAANLGNKVQQGAMAVHALPYRASYPLFGINPLSKKSVGDYLPTWAPLALASGAAGGTFLASPVLAGMASIAKKTNPIMMGQRYPLDTSANLLNAASPGVSIATLPYSSLLSSIGENLGGGILPALGIIGTPLLAGLLARQGYKLYSRAGQAKRLEMLQQQLNKINK